MTMETMKVDGYLPIEQYVPHRGTMLLLDALLDAGDEHAVAQVKVPRDGMFNQAAGVPSWVAVEYMAQTVAAWAGWRALARGDAVKVGFLLGTRKLDVKQPWMAAGAVLTVHAQCELVAGNGLGMFDCRVMHAAQTIAQAKISVFEPEDGKAYLDALQEGS